METGGGSAEAIAQMREWRRLAEAGRYAEAWPYYEARRRHPSFRTVLPKADYPEWTGQDVSGRKVLVVAEQGFGDQLMFGRYLSALSARGAQVEILCNPFFLARLFETLGYICRPFYVDRPAPPADYWVQFCSLPYRLGSAEIPPPRYFDIPLSEGGGVGVVTSGSPDHWNDAQRSMPAHLAARLHAFGRDLLPSATGARDFLETAEIVAGLDLVVTVDTAMAHLAGAIGKPCWVMLPFHGLDWRWGDGVRSPWYPDMRLFRQPALGDWESVIAAVTTALQAR